MGILQNNFQDEELQNFFNNKMEKGLGIGCDLDNNLLFKRGQFNLILGNDNVGKTFYLIWYLTMLSVKQNLKWTLYCAENEVWSVKQKIMNFYVNKVLNIKYVEEKEFFMAKNWVEHYFNFVDTSKLYTLKELLEVFKSSKADGFLIDPYNSLLKERGVNSHEYDYEMASAVRLFTRETNKTIYISMHPVTEASRNKHADGEFKGQPAPPIKSHAEGGQKWANRCDDFIIVHRYFTETMKNKSLVFVEKIKETETGGERTPFGEPLVFEFKPYGFSINGIDPNKEEQEQTKINQSEIYDYQGGMQNYNFDEPAPF